MSKDTIGGLGSNKLNKGGTFGAAKRLTANKDGEKI